MVRVTPERKEQWEQMADELGMSMPETIRYVMEMHDSGNGNSGNVELDTDIGGLMETVESVDGRTENIHSQLSTMSSALVEIRQLVEGEVTEVEQQAVIEQLPEKDDVTRRDRYDKGEYSEDIDPEAMPTPHSIAHELDAPEGAVRRTLEQLALQSPRVKRVEYNDGQGEGYYLDV